MNILVVEDIKEQRESLVKILERNFIDCRVYSCDSVRKALEIAREKEINLFLLDIELSDGSGMELAREIRNIKKYILTGIVFITSNIIHIMEAFKGIHCYDFLVKPYKEEDVKDIVDIFCKNTNNTNKEGNYIVITIDGCITTKVYYEDIVYIEYCNRNCIITTKNDTIIAKGYGLNKILKKINYDNIIQCHKAFAVNKKYIDKIVKVQSKIWDIYFWNCEDIIPVGYKYKDDIFGGIS